MKKPTCEFCYEFNCICHFVNCSICKKELPEGQMYEYRGVLACENCIDEAREKRDFERQEVIAEERHKTEPLRGFDLSDSTRGKANKKLLKANIEIAGKEGGRLKAYENRD